MTSQLVIFRAFLFIFFRPPDPRSEKNSRKSTNKKIWPKSATMNIFRFFLFLFKSFVKVELSYVFTKNLFTILKTARKNELSYKTGVCFSLVGNYLRPSNNYSQLILA